MFKEIKTMQLFFVPILILSPLYVLSNESKKNVICEFGSFYGLNNNIILSNGYFIGMGISKNILNKLNITPDIKYFWERYTEIYTGIKTSIDCKTTILIPSILMEYNIINKKKYLLNFSIGFGLYVSQFKMRESLREDISWENSTSTNLGYSISFNTYNKFINNFHFILEIGYMNTVFKGIESKYINKTFEFGFNGYYIDIIVPVKL